MPDRTIGVQELYDAYQLWFSSTGFKGMLGRKEFGKRVEALGIQKSDRKRHGYEFRGVALR
jgi:phage/plasmid-associated DNA primase